MGPAALAQVLRPLTEMFGSREYPDLLRGLDPPDDAAVWRLDGTRGLVLTSDFFPPVVDHPYHFGAIAAANALSDVYAMGADPLMAINLVGFPDDLEPLILSEILRGGARKVHEAGAVVAGGHTTVDREPKYGLAVVGLVHPDKILAKQGARPGDVLFLTKRLGTGVITTAHKEDKVEAEHLEIATESMARLNRAASLLIRKFEGDIHAVSDISGYGFAGHAHELALHSGVSLRINWHAVPQLPGAVDYADQGLVTGGAGRNRDYYGEKIRFDGELMEPDRQILYDPQTSGGLLFAAAPQRADEIEKAFAVEAEPLWRIGAVASGDPGTILIA